MKVYISGITGTGMGPLALMAKAAGIEVFGSDLAEGAIYSELKEKGIEVSVGEQDGRFLKTKLEGGIDWFVYTSALPKDHPELVVAQEAGIKATKRDDFTAFLVDKLGLKMVAVAGTHGKTTTTSMIVWAAVKLKLPVSYIVGTTLGFAPSGAYHEGDKFFVYEADEYDRNFLKYQPWLAVIPFVSYDHPDIYPTKEDYLSAFEQFKSQSGKVITEREVRTKESDFSLSGKARRKDARLATEAVLEMLAEIKRNGESDGGADKIASGTVDKVSGSYAEEVAAIIEIINEFPGVFRRFEKISEGVYTDYAHHPEEIMATIEVAKEEAKKVGRKGVVVVYQPHQNTRQHEVFRDYRQAFLGAEKVFWLPTYLTRENPDLKVIRPEEFIDSLENKEVAKTAELDDGLFFELEKLVAEGYLVVLMTAGPADGEFRKRFLSR